MSIYVHFRTGKQLEPEQIFKEIVNRGISIIVTEKEFPCVKYGTVHEALRGIEINQTENGYEVRVCSFANKSDLRLFVETVDAMKYLTKAKAFLDDDEEQEIENPKEIFGEEWVNENVEDSMIMNCALVKHLGETIVMDGLFSPFCFGPKMATWFNVNLSKPTIDAFLELQDYLTNMQWYLSDKKDTSTRILIPNEKNDEDRPLSVSLIAAEKGKVKNNFDFVSYADLLCLMDMTTKEMVLIHMADFWKILPEKGFSLIDDFQVEKKEDLSIETFNELKEKAKLFQVEDLFYHPVFPGNGYDDKQKTYVLMWNPAISSVKMEDHNESIPNLLTEHFNWSISEYENAKKGDRFVLVRCGGGKTGIVMSGVFDSNPYQAGDWSGRGRKVYYMDMIPNFIVNPEKVNLITTDYLQLSIPSFDWRGGRSGRLLTEEQAKKLEKILAEYLVQFSNNMDGENVNGFLLPQPNSSD